ncbi:hypothetical protein D3C76_1632840 [compost metagenome]
MLSGMVVGATGFSWFGCVTGGVVVDPPDEPPDDPPEAGGVVVPEPDDGLSAGLDPLNPGSTFSPLSVTPPAATVI